MGKFPPLAGRITAWLIIVLLLLAGCARSAPAPTSAPATSPPRITPSAAPPPAIEEAPASPPTPTGLVSAPPAASPQPTGQSPTPLQPAISPPADLSVSAPTPFVPGEAIDEATLGRLELLRTIGYGRVTSAAAAPPATQGGRGSPGLLAVGSEAGIAFFELATRDFLRFQPVRGGVSGLDLSPDGRLVAAVSGDQTLLLRLPGFETVATLAGHAPRFSPDGRYLATQAGESRYWSEDLANTTTTIWSAVDGAALATVPGYAAAFSPDGASLATTDGAAVLVSQLPGGARIARHAVAIQHDPHNAYTVAWESYAKDVAFADGRVLVAIGGEVQEFDVVGGLLRVIDMPGDGSFPARTDFLSPGGAFAGVSSKAPEGPVPTRLVSIAGGAKIYKSPNNDWDNAIEFSADGSIALQWAEYYGGALRVIDLAAGQVLGELDLPSFRDLEISPDGQLLAAAGQRDTYLWDFGDPSFRRLIPNELPEVLRFAPDSLTLRSAGYDARILYGDASLIVREWSLGGAGPVEASKTLKPFGMLALSPTGAILAGTGDPRTVTLLEPDGRERRLNLLEEDVPQWQEMAGAFSQDGAVAAVGTQAGAVAVFDTASGSLIGQLDLEEKVRHLAFSPDGGMLVAQTETGRMTVWVPGSDMAPLEFEGEPAHKLVLSADNQLLIACGEGRLAIYRLGDGRLLRTIEVDASDVAIGPYRHIMAILSAGQIQVWGIKP